jgi:ribosomal protein S18 acetylase RimI-like enzyme
MNKSKLRLSDKISFANVSDSSFSEALIKSTMDGYYQARSMTWDHHQFMNTWEQWDNYEVILDDLSVGVVRLSYGDKATYLRDLHLLPECQRMGLGLACLNLIVQMAKDRKSSTLALRVFEENPALAFYEKFGFVRLSMVDGLVEMGFVLD